LIPAEERLSGTTSEAVLWSIGRFGVLDLSPPRLDFFDLKEQLNLEGDFASPPPRLEERSDTYF
jgi:hypothetical protein